MIGSGPRASASRAILLSIAVVVAEHAPTSFTPRMGRAGEVLNPTRGFAEDATPRTRAAVEARQEEEAEEEDRGWSLDDALAATDVVVDWAANLWSRVTGATAAPVVVGTTARGAPCQPESSAAH